MNFSSMEYFEVLSRERNFTRAAELLHITQQTLSAHIASLEKELGCQLVVRHVPLELTYAGEVFLRYAEQFRKERGTMLQEFCDITENQKGVLRVGITWARGRILMPKLIAAFQRDYPNICVELDEDSNDVLLQHLKNREIDLAIASFPEAVQDVATRDYYVQETALLISDQLFREVYGTNAGQVSEAFESGDFTMLGSCPLVLRREGYITESIARTLFRQFHIEQPIIRARSSNLQTLVDLCREGVGGCFCPINLGGGTGLPEQDPGILCFSLGETAKYQIRFAYLPQTYQWSVVEAFMDCGLRGLPHKE